MRKWCCSIILPVMFLFFSGCAYLDPGENPARLTVHAQASIDPAWADDFLRGQVLSMREQIQLKWGGTLRGPLWAIKAYQRDGKDNLRPLLPVQGGMFEGLVSHNFAGSREFLLPPGQYTVEVWLVAYMHYCLGVGWDSCATPTLRIWSMSLEQNDFTPGGVSTVVLDGAQAGEGSRIQVR